MTYQSILDDLKMFEHIYNPRVDVVPPPAPVPQHPPAATTFATTAAPPAPAYFRWSPINLISMPNPRREPQDSHEERWTPGRVLTHIAMPAGLYVATTLYAMANDDAVTFYRSDLDREVSILQGDMGLVCYYQHWRMLYLKRANQNLLTKAVMCMSTLIMGVGVLAADIPVTSLGAAGFIAAAGCQFWNFLTGKISRAETGAYYALKEYLMNEGEID